MNNEKLWKTDYAVELYTWAPFSVLLPCRRKRACLRVTHFREALRYCSAERAPENPCFSSTGTEKMYMMSLIRGDFIQTDLPQKSVVERKMRGLIPTTLLGFAANSNNMFENTLKLKKIIFLSVTTLLWAISANMDLTEGLHMWFFYFNFCPTPTFWTVSTRTMCASADVFTLVATFLVAIYFHINSKMSSVLKP